MGSMRTRALGGVDFAADIGERWFEDYVVGAVYEYGYLEVSEEGSSGSRGGSTRSRSTSIPGSRPAVRTAG